MSKRYGITAVTSSMFDNENVIIGCIVRYNELKGVLIHLNTNESAYSLALNDKINALTDIFKKNRKISDVMKVIKTKAMDNKWSHFDKPIMVTNDNLSKEGLIKYVKSLVFTSLVDVSEIDMAEVITTLPLPKTSSEPSIEIVNKTEEVVVEEPTLDVSEIDMAEVITTLPLPKTSSEPSIEIVNKTEEVVVEEPTLDVSEQETLDLLADVPDSVEGDYDNDDSMIDPNELIDQKEEVVEDEDEDDDDPEYGEVK